MQVIRSTSQSRDGLAFAFAAIVLLAGAVAVLVAVGPVPSAAPGRALAGAATAASEAIGASVPSPSGQVAADVVILDVADPESAVSDILVKEYGATCLTGSDVLVQEDPASIKALDARIAAGGLKSAWIEEGIAFVGTGASAVRAFNAVAAFGDNESIWIVVAGTRPTAMELRATRTPAGHTVWAPINHITVSANC